MHVDVIACASEAISDDFINKTVIVVDVLRATSSIITALEYGSTGIIPVETVYQARNIQTSGDLLGGERYCKKISGFDFGNSPAEYREADIRGKRIIMTTTNGIRAIQKAQKATHIIAGAIINAAACAKAAIQLNRDIIVVCAGTHDEFSLEDGLGAGAIIDELIRYSENDTVQLNDFGTSMHCTYTQLKNNLPDAVLNCANGRKLAHMEFHNDVVWCAQENLFSMVPILQDHVLVPFEVLKS
jgi:2-phosphosulfolactate phosphatase